MSRLSALRQPGEASAELQSPGGTRFGDQRNGYRKASHSKENQLVKNLANAFTHPSPSAKHKCDLNDLLR